MDPLFAAVIQNKTFYNKFLATIKEIGSTNFDHETRCQKLDNLTALYQPLMQDFYTNIKGNSNERPFPSYFIFLRLRGLSRCGIPPAQPAVPDIHGTAPLLLRYRFYFHTDRIFFLLKPVRDSA